MQQSSFEELAFLGRQEELPREIPDVVAPEDDRFLPSGDEAGTAPGDRKFRPDVEGLRAVAILLVVLYHAAVPGLTGRFVGVDVFFVISGFVITGLLLREHASSGKTRLGAFYGRRSRRILPAATLVIVITVLASYKWLGFITGNATATVAKTAALFYANFHFIATGTNYLAAQQPPSALQKFLVAFRRGAVLPRLSNSVHPRRSELETRQHAAQDDGSARFRHSPLVGMVALPDLDQ